MNIEPHTILTANHSVVQANVYRQRIAIATGYSPPMPLPRARLLLRRPLQSQTDRYYLYVPETLALSQPPLVSIHGISRNSREHAAALAPLAERLGCAVVAPHFAAPDWRGYQRLEYGARQRSPLILLDHIVDEVRAMLNLSSRRCRLAGFSAGAQFAHRYALQRAGSVHSLALSAAGWYSLPDSTLAYPLGVGTSKNRNSHFTAASVDLSAWLALPMHVSVGSDDREALHLRRNPALDSCQGITREQRAASFVSAVRAAAAARGIRSHADLLVVGGARHHYNDVMRCGLANALANWYQQLESADV